MEKKQLINYVNTQFKGNLNSHNTSYASINKAKAVWWYTIPFSRFEQDVHLLLADKDQFLWITLPKGFVSNLSGTFRIRKATDAVDIEISADRNTRHLVDVKSGGTGFDFRKYVKEVIVY